MPVYILFLTRVCSVLTNHTFPTITALRLLVTYNTGSIGFFFMSHISCSWRTYNMRFCMTSKGKLATQSHIQETTDRVRGPRIRILHRDNSPNMAQCNRFVGVVLMG